MSVGKGSLARAAKANGTGAAVIANPERETVKLAESAQKASETAEKKPAAKKPAEKKRVNAGNKQARKKAAAPKSVQGQAVAASEPVQEQKAAVSAQTPERRDGLRVQSHLICDLPTYLL